MSEERMFVAQRRVHMRRALKMAFRRRYEMSAMRRVVTFERQKRTPVPSRACLRARRSASATRRRAVMFTRCRVLLSRRMPRTASVLSQIY